MANITPLKSKTGDITGYRIRVFHYEDSNGKKHFYSKNWQIPSGYKSEKAIQQALQKEVGEFEAACGRGNVSPESKTVLEYCTYYINVNDLKPASVRFYKSLLPFIESEIGYIKLKNLTPEHLDNFYQKLKTADVKRDAKATANARCTELFKKTINERKGNGRDVTKISAKDAAESIGIAENTLREARQGKKVSVETADKISAYFGKPAKDLFSISTSGTGLSIKMIRHIHSFLYSVLNFAVEKGALNVNVAARVKPPKAKTHEAEFFELPEIHKIKAALQQEPLRYQIATYLLIDTGCRRGELCAIRWSSIDFDKATIKLDRNVQYIEGFGMVIGTPKGGKARTVSIARELIPVLKEYKRQQENDVRIKYSCIENAIDRHKAIKAHNPEGYLFTQENGSVMSPSALNSWSLRFSKKTGLHIHPHKFRHSQASLLFASGVDVVTVSKRLGHAQVSTTQNIYAHLLEGSDRHASDTLSALLFKEA